MSTMENVPTGVPITRQLRIARRSEGGRHGRRLQRSAIPRPMTGEVLLRLHAVSIQRVDIETLPELPEGSPPLQSEGLIAGADGAGEIIEVGAHVSSVRPGEKVVTFLSPRYLEHPLDGEVLYDTLGESANGVHADYAVVKETAVAPMPGHLSFVEAAALTSSGVTAWSGLGIEQGLVREGSTVLVEGTGGVSTFALQFAVALGAKVVAISSSDEKLSKMRALGAAVTINYRTNPGWGDEVVRCTGGHGADVVLDMGGASTLQQSLKALAYEGTLSLVGGLGGFDNYISTLQIQLKAANIRGVLGGPRSDFLRMCKFLEAHGIHPIVERTYPFEDFERAYDHLASGNFVGKLVLTLTE